MNLSYRHSKCDLHHQVIFYIQDTIPALFGILASMNTKPTSTLNDGEKCRVIGGVHIGKSGIVRDIKTGKTGHVSITVVQADGERFKTLAKNVTIFE